MTPPCRAILAALGAVLTGSCTTTPQGPTRAACVAAPAPEWNGLFERSSGWIGGDGAATVALPGGRVLWLFGDSGIGRVEKGKYAPGSTLVNNSVAVQLIPEDHDRRASGGSASSEIEFAWGARGADGAPAALFVARREGEWYWPTGGGAALDEGGTTLVLFMSRLFRPREKDNSIWNFEGRGSDLLWIENPGPDPLAWRPEIIATPGAGGDKSGPTARRITWGTSVWVRPGRPGAELYIFGVDTSDPGNKKAVLARAESTAVRDVTRWRFWSGGEAPWSAHLEDAAPVAGHVMDEYSVSWLAEGGGADSARFVMVYSEPMLGRRVFARAAHAPAGPWSEPVAIYTCPEPAADARIIVYSAKAHPALSDRGELLVSYCVNSTDFWHMLSDAAIYRPRFIRVPVSLLPVPPGEARLTRPCDGACVRPRR